MAPAVVRAAVAVAIATAAPARRDPDGDARARRRVTATRVQVPIVVDGHLDEAPWRERRAATASSSSSRTEGAPSSQPSEVRFLYDEATLYVGGTFLDDATGDRSSTPSSATSPPATATSWPSSSTRSSTAATRSPSRPIRAARSATPRSHDDGRQLNAGLERRLDRPDRPRRRRLDDGDGDPVPHAALSRARAAALGPQHRPRAAPPQRGRGLVAGTPPVHRAEGVLRRRPRGHRPRAGRAQPARQAGPRRQRPRRPRPPRCRPRREVPAGAT